MCCCFRFSFDVVLLSLVLFPLCNSSLAYRQSECCSLNMILSICNLKDLSLITRKFLKSVTDFVVPNCATHHICDTVQAGYFLDHRCCKRKWWQIIKGNDNTIITSRDDLHTKCRLGYWEKTAAVLRQAVIFPYQ